MSKEGSANRRRCQAVGTGIEEGGEETIDRRRWISVDRVFPLSLKGKDVY